jgi:hypothetical protein
VKAILKKGNFNKTPDFFRPKKIIAVSVAKNNIVMILYL